MQPYTGGPRSSLAVSDVLNLLTTSATVKVTPGLEKYDSLLNFVTDLSSSLQPGSSVASDALATVHRSCTLLLDSNAPINYLKEYVKPYVTLTDTLTGVSARFNLGMYALTSPTPDLTLSPGMSNYTGYDLLQNLNQPVGDTYELAAGSEPVAAAAALIVAAFPVGANVQTSYEASTSTLATAYSWPLDSSNQFTYLDIVNTLLVAAGWQPLWVDWDGVFQMHKYQDPNDPTRTPAWTFDYTPGVVGSTVKSSRSVYQDLYGVPNTWVYVMNNLTAAPVEGSTQFTFIDTVSPGTSTTARGRTVKKVVFVDAADFPSLAIAAIQDIAIDLSAAETFAISTFPLPIFWHRDIVSYVDPTLANVQPLASANRRCMAVQWTLPLDVSGGDMAFTLASTTTATTVAATQGGVIIPITSS